MAGGRKRKNYKMICTEEIEDTTIVGHTSAAAGQSSNTQDASPLRTSHSFVPAWSLTQTDLVGNSPVLSNSFLHGCLPPNELAIYRGVPDERLRMELAQSVVHVIGQTRELIARDDARGKARKALDDELEDLRKEVKRLNLKGNKDSHRIRELERNEAERNDLLTKSEVTTQRLAKKLANAKAQARILALEGWELCLDKVRSEFPDIDHSILEEPGAKVRREAKEAKAASRGKAMAEVSSKSDEVMDEVSDDDQE